MRWLTVFWGPTLALLLIAIMLSALSGCYVPRERTVVTEAMWLEAIANAERVEEREKRAQPLDRTCSAVTAEGKIVYYRCSGES